MTGPLSAYGSEIYLNGMGGQRPSITTDLTAVEDVRPAGDDARGVRLRRGCGRFGCDGAREP